MSTTTSRFQRLVLPALVVLGAVFYWPAIRARFLLDDYLHASMVRGTFPVRRGPFDLYNFINDQDRAVLSAHGLLPWWSNPFLKVRFFRPLSSALLWADHRLFGEALVPLHLHSFLWWLAAVVSARALLRRVLKPRPALVATFIFALAPCHALPLAWLANREALVSLTFGLLGLGALLDVEQRARATDVIKTVGFFGLSLLGGEYALGMGGYVLAMVLLIPNISKARRALGAASFALPTLGYLAVRKVLDYGTSGSGFYTDPLADPLMFLEQSPRRLGTLLVTAYASLDGETIQSSTPSWLIALVIVIGGGLLVRTFRRSFAALEDDERASVRWLLSGSFLALLPVLAVVPSPRLLGASMLGIAAAVAVVIDVAWFRKSDRNDELGGLVALGLGFAHLIHGPATSWLVARSYQISSIAFAASAERLSSHLEDPGKADVMVMRAMGGSFFMPFALRPDFAPPRRWRMVAQTGHLLALRRAPNVVELVASDSQGIYPSGSGNLFRSETTPAYVGKVIDFAGERVTILEMGSRGPRRIRLETDADLDSFDWVAEEKIGFRDVTPPPVGFGQPFDP